MRFTRTVVATLAMFASASAFAAVTGSLGGGAGTFHTLNAPGSCAGGCTLGAIGSISGGTIYTADQPFADIPAGVVVDGRFLAAGPTSGSPSTLTFSGGGVPYISFLWGSPDTYNQLTVNSTGGGSPQVFTASSLSFAVTNGNQSFSQYVQFAGVGGSLITSLVFTNTQAIDAFEVSNFSTTVPEPGTLALFGAGLLGMWMAVRRRKGTLEATRGMTAA